MALQPARGTIPYAVWRQCLSDTLHPAPAALPVTGCGPVSDGRHPVLAAQLKDGHPCLNAQATRNTERAEGGVELLYDAVLVNDSNLSPVAVPRAEHPGLAACPER